MESVNEIWPVYVIQEKKILKNPTKIVTWELNPGPFVFAKY